MGKLQKLLWPFKRERQERDFKFISILEHTHYTQTSYVIQASSKKVARQRFKVFLQAARKSECPYYHPAVNVTEHHFQSTRAYCLQSDFMPVGIGDQLMQQYYRHRLFEPRPAKVVGAPTVFRKILNSILFTG